MTDCRNDHERMPVLSSLHNTFRGRMVKISLANVLMHLTRKHKEFAAAK